MGQGLGLLVPYALNNAPTRSMTLIEAIPDSGTEAN